MEQYYSYHTSNGPAYYSLSNGTPNFNLPSEVLGRLKNGQLNSSSSANSPFSNFANAGNTPSHLPSSSSSSVLGANANSAMGGVTQPPQRPNLDQGFKDFMTQGGFSEDELNNMNSADRFGYFQSYQATQEPKKAADQAKADEDRIYNEKLAEENAAYGAASQKLEIQRKKDIDSAKALGYSANPYAATSSSEGEGGSFSSAISTKYAQLQAELDAGAMQAKAALAAGNASAYADINTKLASITESGLKDIASLSETIRSRQNQDKIVALNEQTRNQGIADKELQTITSDTADKILSLPSDTSGFSPAQMSTLTGTPGYNALITAGLTPQDALGYIKNAATSNKQQLAEAKTDSEIKSANLRNILLQNKVINQQIETNAAAGYSSNPLGSNFAAAYNNIIQAGVTDKVNPGTGLTLHGSIGAALTNGDTVGAKKQLENLAITAAKKQNPTGVTLYQSFSSISGLMNILQKDIAALPQKDQTGIANGTIETIGKYFGNNPKGYQAAKVIDDISLLTAAHARFMGGARGLSPSELTYLKQVMPSYSNIGTLNLASFKTFSDFSSVLGKDVLGDVIGKDNYDAIYGKSTATQPPLTVTVPSGSTAGYSESTGHWYAKDSSGKVSLIQ